MDSDRPRVDVRFTRVPERVTLMLERRELRFEDYALLVFLASRADYRSRQATFATLGVLKESCNWPTSEDNLRKRLRKLRELGELHFPDRQGSRSSWVVDIVPGDYFGRPEASSPVATSDRTPPSHSGVTSDPSEVERPANPQRDALDGLPSLPTVRSDNPLDVDVEVDLALVPDEAPDTDVGAETIAAIAATSTDLLMKNRLAYQPNLRRAVDQELERRQVNA